MSENEARQLRAGTACIMFKSPGGQRAMSERDVLHGSARDVLDFIDGIYACLSWRNSMVLSAARRCGRWTKSIPVRWGEPSDGR